MLLLLINVMLLLNIITIFKNRRVKVKFLYRAPTHLIHFSPTEKKKRKPGREPCHFMNVLMMKQYMNIGTYHL